MPHIIKVVTPPHPPNGFHNEFVEYVQQYNGGNIMLVREQIVARVFPTFGSAMSVARDVQADLPERTVSVVPIVEQG